MGVLQIMHKNRIYIICLSTLPNFECIQEYRELADRITFYFEYRILWYGARFLKKQLFGTRKIRMYKKAENTYFDTIPLNEFDGFHYAGTNINKSRLANFYLYFDYDHEKNEMYTTIILEEEKCKFETLINRVDGFKKNMQDIFEIITIVADSMDSEKDVPFFVAGIGGVR